MASTYPATFNDQSGLQRLDGSVTFTSASNVPGYGPNPITSGALPTVTLTSAQASQVSTSRDATLGLYWTTDATNNAATLKVELSPNNSDFTTLDTLSIAAGVNNLGAVQLLHPLLVPAGWYVKVTAVHATIGATGVCAYY